MHAVVRHASWFAAIALALTGCASAPHAPTADPDTIARRQTVWAGAHQVRHAALEYGGENEATMTLVLSPTTPPVFQSWSESETRVTPSSVTRRRAAIPGEIVATRASELSGGDESVQQQFRNALVKASFDPDYTTLTLLYRDSSFDGLLKRSFRLDESTEPHRVIGDEGSVYTKLP